MMGFRSQQPPTQQPLVLPSFCCRGRSGRQGDTPAWTAGWETAACKLCLPTFSILYCISSILNHLGLKGLGKLCLAEATAGERWSQSVGEILPLRGEWLGCLGPADWSSKLPAERPASSLFVHPRSSPSIFCATRVA